MKKYMVADLLKDANVCSLENLGGCKEYNDDIGIGPVQYKGKYYNLEIEFDPKQDNYVVTIDYDKGGSSELIVSGSDAGDILDNGLDESKRNPPMPWPFGDKEFLHWPNQMG